jgi:Mg-chelatase subunit ChlD
MTSGFERIPNRQQREFISLDYDKMKEIADYYLINGDLNGLLALSNYSQVLVAELISEKGLPERVVLSMERDPEAAVKLYRQVRWKLNERSRSLFKRLIAKIVIKISSGDSRGFSVNSREYSRAYSPGMEFDLERTIERIIERCKNVDEIRYEDIVASDKRKRDKSLIIILDSSGSMTGKKILLAMMIAAIASHKLRGGRYGIVGFNSTAFIIKSPMDDKDSIRVIEEILDLVPIGYTNIADGLKKGLEISYHLKNPKYLLITDGEYNVGEDPRKIAKRFKNLCVIHTKGKRDSKGSALCREIARIGGDKYFSIDDIKQIQRVMRSILD